MRSARRAKGARQEVATACQEGELGWAWSGGGALRREAEGDPPPSARIPKQQEATQSSRPAFGHTPGPAGCLQPLPG